MFGPDPQNHPNDFLLLKLMKGENQNTGSKATVFKYDFAPEYIKNEVVADSSLY